MQLLMVGMAGSIARYREMQILKRIQVTPVRPSAFIVGQVSSQLILAFGVAGRVLTVEGTKQSRRADLSFRFGEE